MGLFKKLAPKNSLEHAAEPAGDSREQEQDDSPRVKRQEDRNEKIMCKIRLLEDSQMPLEISISRTDLGRRIFTFVCGSIGDLAESDYFGLRYTDKHGQRQWLDLDRAVHKQLKGCKTFNLSFRLKHYPAYPFKDIKQELTRYLVYLQIRRDLTQGRLLCPPELMGQIGALIAQAELGDAPPEEELDLPNATTDSSPSSLDTTNSENQSPRPTPKHTPVVSYLKNFKIFNSQTPRTLVEIAKQHQKLRGLTNQEAESELLSRSSQLPTYGIDPFPVTPLHKVIVPTSLRPAITEAGDQAKSLPETNSSAPATQTIPTYLPKGIAFYLGITNNGLVTFVGLQRCKEYFWDQIQRVVCDGRQLIVHLKRDDFPSKRRFLRNKAQHLTFECESKAAALAIWHWTMDRKFFFTLKQAIDAKRVRPSSNIFRRSHTYRFSGRSHQELSLTPIKNSSAEFIRISTLRRDGGFGSASVGHATLPGRLRPPLDLQECRQSELVEVPAESPIVSEPLRPVVIPDTVLEHPAEGESPTMMVIGDEEIRPVSQPACSAQPVKEPTIEVKRVSQQMKSHDMKSLDEVETNYIQDTSGIRNRVDPNLVQSVVYQQVVSEFDHTVDTHVDRFSNPKTNACLNGFAQNNGGATIVGNGPISQKASGFPVISGDHSESNRCWSETVKPVKRGGAAKVTTVTVVAVMVLLGLIVFMETSPNSKSTIIHTLRGNTLVSSFDAYVYGPLRNAISNGLALLWS